MEVILRQAVENLGKPGDVVKVSNGLCPQLSPAARRRLSRRRPATSSASSRSAIASRPRRTSDAPRLRVSPRSSSRSQLTFSARVGEEGKLFGSVTSADIAQQLEAQGFHVEKRQIDLHEPIKALGVYRVPIRLHADVKPEIRVWVIKG